MKEMAAFIMRNGLKNYEANTTDPLVTSRADL